MNIASLLNARNVQPTLEDAKFFLSVVHATHQPSSDIAPGLIGVSTPLLNAVAAEGRSFTHTIAPKCGLPSSIPTIRTAVKGKRKASPPRHKFKSKYSRKTEEAARSQNKAADKKPRIRKSKTNKSEAERLQELKQDQLIGQIEPHWVFCLGCRARVALDQRNRYYAGLWNEHKARYHTPVSDVQTFKGYI